MAATVPPCERPVHYKRPDARARNDLMHTRVGYAITRVLGRMPGSIRTRDLRHSATSDKFLTPLCRCRARSPLPIVQLGQPQPPVGAEFALRLALPLFVDPGTQAETLFIGVGLSRRGVPELLDVLFKAAESVLPPSVSSRLRPSWKFCETLATFVAKRVP
jgi:hypothetical protein